MKKILIIDDDDVFVKTLSDSLSKEKYIVVRAQDGEDGLEKIEKEISRVLCNHLGEFELAAWSIENIKKWTMKRGKMPLYNLSVEEDESYIAKGIVVHNCRCIALPYIEDIMKYENN